MEEDKEEDKDTWSYVVGLAEKLLLIPGLQAMGKDDRDAVRADLDLVHTFIAQSRAPRIAIFAPENTPVDRLFEALLGLGYFGNLSIKRHLGKSRWYDFSNGRGALRLLDASQTEGDFEGLDATLKALCREQADAALILCSLEDLENDEFLDYLDTIAARMSEQYGEAVPTIVVLTTSKTDDDTRYRTEVRNRLRKTAFARHNIYVSALYTPDDLLERLVQHTPAQTRFCLATVVPSPRARQELAGELIAAFTKISAALSAIRLPVADLVPMTALQVGLVIAIARLSGREPTWQTTVGFLATLGIQMGAVRALSRGMHRAVRSMPMLRPFLSAGVSASTTQLIGNAASAHFIGARR
ncbi:MAG: hypothetical protein ACNA8W_09445 [Bradymonadaceae bacterium]